MSLAEKKGIKLASISAVESEATAFSEAFEPSLPESSKTGTDMEPASPPVPFPLLKDYRTYDPLSFPLRRPSDSPAELTDGERQWVGVFRKSISSFRDRAAADTTVPDATQQADVFAVRYTSILDDFETDPQSHGGPPDILVMCRLRDLVLRELGFFDIFKTIKEAENSKALKLLPPLLSKLDSMKNQRERAEFLVKGMLAGNVFDLGASSTIEMFDKGELSFETSFDKLLSRPWAVDDMDKFVAAWSERNWRKVVIFVDNAGADTILGVLPIAREFLKSGAQVVVAGNELPTINDMTYQDLLDVAEKLQTDLEDEVFTLALDKGSLLMVNSGSHLPVIDLSTTSPELAFASDGAELVILVGMGRAIETNLYAEFNCDSLNIGMIKHPEVAEFLKGRLYDGVVKYKAASLKPATSNNVVKEPVALA